MPGMLRDTRRIIRRARDSGPFPVPLTCRFKRGNLHVERGSFLLIWIGQILAKWGMQGAMQLDTRLILILKSPTIPATLQVRERVESGLVWCGLLAIQKTTRIGASTMRNPPEF